MKLLKAVVDNFGSYNNLEFDFSSSSLALVYGATGSGKSTLQDIPTWILYGQTAKGGNVDDIRSWGCDQHTVTKGVLHIAIRDLQIAITRTRGKSGQNDLYWDVSGQIYRGKDITETQKLLNEYLGIDYFTYTIGAYYNEFSPTGSFFTAKASDRRELLEGLADLSLPSLLLERIADAKKQTRKTYTETLERFNKTDGRLEQLRRSEVSTKRDAEGWSKSQESLIQELRVKSEKFNEEKESKIQVAQLKLERYEVARKEDAEKYQKDLDKKIARFAIDKKCLVCGTIKAEDENHLLELNEEYEFLIKRTLDTPNPFIATIESIKSQTNNYEDRIKDEQGKSNPFITQLQRIKTDLMETEASKKEAKEQLDSLNHKVNALAQLGKLNDEFRGQLLKQKVKSIESDTNRYLETYFDSELKVDFKLDGGDSLDITIAKSGHEASYRQLSKGQRSLLKLCFSVSAMKAVADKCGVHFDTLMFDEALDGLDNSLKLKAFNLFSELNLSHSTILVIDHAESLQSMFDTRYHVTISQDLSNIEEV